MAHGEPQSITIELGGPIDRAEITALCERVHALIERSGADVVTCELGCLGRVDFVAVDALARMQLTAGRLGCSLQLRHACFGLRALLALTGLTEVLPVCR